MNPTASQYYGSQSDYPKMVRFVSSDEGQNIQADVIFEELMENKVFIKEAKEARKGLIKNPKRYPNLTLKYKSLIEK